MLNQIAVEGLYSATYVEDYLDCIETLPDELQRHITELRELDSKYQELLKNLDHQHEAFKKESDSHLRRKTFVQMQQALVKGQELGDEKLQILSQIIDHVENKSRHLDQDYRNLDFGKDQENQVENKKEETPVQEKSSKRARRQRNQDSFTKDDSVTEKHHEKEKTSKSKKKKRKTTKAEKEREASPVEPPIDPDEPTYCLCEQVSYGEMIGCDNEECPIEWFHFSCVGLTSKPKGKWYCPKCRGDRSNQMKSTR